MEDLEPVLPAGVQVTSIEPVREKNGDLTLHLRISGPRERSVETIRNMEHSRRFVAPRIAGENSENSSSQGNLKPVSAAGKVTFEVLAEYNQATLDERKAAMGQEKRAHQNPTGAAAAAALPVPLRPAGIPRGPLNLPANANNPVRQPSQMPAGQPFSGPGIPPRPGPRGQNPALLPNGMPNPNPTPGGPQ
jgi:type IV pilus assembly protein PilN